MPDGTQPRRPRSAPALAETAKGGIVQDAVDVRDRSYEPTLQRLQPELIPHDLFEVLRDGHNPWRLPRNQGDEGTCGGQALAALIDIERTRAEAATGDRYPSSARMIYQTALLKADSEGDEGVSLRDVIKAFYNYGVCRETLWPYVAGDGDPGTLNVERARDARNLSLGAYYRLRPNLNIYHAALHETGAVLVSAELHDGWLHRQLAANAGVVVPPPRGAPRGALSIEKHAFVIVGYTREGFLVLNSWGRDWGNWVPKGGGPVPGVGLWRYEDWADTIMDGWVLRLGAGAAEAFDYSIGDQGLGFGADGAVRSTPVHAILGHFLHLDDGDYVRRGAFVSTRITLEETLRLLKQDAAEGRYRGALLTFAGGILGLKEATEQVARWRRPVREAGWYPFTVLWCVDYAEQARAVLDGVFAEALGRAGAPGPRLDRIIEERAHGIGRAFWRDIICAAERAARPNGPLHDLAWAAAELRRARPGFRLRIIAESEGAYALAALVRALLTEPFAAQRESFFAMLESVDLVVPPLSFEEFSALAVYLGAGWGEARRDRRINLHLPSARDEKRLAVPPYGGSYFELVRLAFQRRDDGARPAEITCASRAKPAIASKWDAWRTVPRSRLVPVAWPKGKAPDQGPIDQIELIYRSDVAGRLRGALAPG